MGFFSFSPKPNQEEKSCVHEWREEKDWCWCFGGANGFCDGSTYQCERCGGYGYLNSKKVCIKCGDEFINE